MNSHSKLNSILSSEFHKFLMKNSQMAEKIPPNALVIFQVNGDEEFNNWNLEASLKNRETNQPVIKVMVNK